MLAGFQVIHFLDKVVEFGSHEGLGCCEIELGGGEFGNDILDVVQVGFGVCRISHGAQ